MRQELRGIAACAGMSALLMLGVATTAVAATTPPKALAMDQKIKNNQVVLTYAYLPSKGYAVVYGSDADGKPETKPLGFIELSAGDHRGVKINIEGQPEKGSKLWVSLYEDADGKPGFDRGADKPYWSGQLPSVNQLEVQ